MIAPPPVPAPPVPAPSGPVSPAALAPAPLARVRRWRLRPARRKEARALAALVARWRAEAPWLPRGQAAALTTAAAIAEDAACLRALIERAEVVCLAGWFGPEGFLAREGEVVHALYVAPRARGRGAGARLLAHAKAASGTGRLRLWVHAANRRARAFYRRHGFAEVAFGDGTGNDEGLPEVRLEWQREG